MKMQMRNMFEEAIKLILIAEEGSPEFNFAFAVIQSYRVFIFEKRSQEYQCDNDDILPLETPSGCF